MSLTVAPSTNAEHENGVEEAERYKGCVEAGGWGADLVSSLHHRRRQVLASPGSRGRDRHRGLFMFAPKSSMPVCGAALSGNCYAGPSSLLLTLSRVGRKIKARSKMHTGGFGQEERMRTTQGKDRMRMDKV